jgi:NADH dehydrogenase [ubiquinone] 1 alpha subcomplex assembly factor 3
MPPLRPTKSSVSRPSIHDLSTFLLSPQTYSARCHSSLTRHHHLTHSRTYTLQFRSAISTRRFTTQPRPLSAPKSKDRGPVSEENTQTDFGSLNVLGSTPAPSTSIDACLWDGFHLNSGVKIVGGSGVLLVAGEAFGWRPWEAGTTGKDGGMGKMRLLNEKGQWEVGDDAWGLLGLVWPKPGMYLPFYLHENRMVRTFRILVMVWCSHVDLWQIC